LKYAYQDAAGWHITTVFSHGAIGSYTSLALDGGGYPHISYSDETHGDLKYASLIPPTPYGVFIHGARAGIPSVVYPFIASATPFTPTVPITYVWGADDQLPITHTGGTTDTVAFTWGTTGTKVITVSAYHISATLINTHTIAIVEPKAYFPFVPQNQASLENDRANQPGSQGSVTMPITVPLFVITLITSSVRVKRSNRRRE
jgi:hypothetical protein